MIDVVITVKNRDKLFKQCIKSLEKAEHVKIYVQPFDYNGVGSARINAINSSKNDYICFVDPDDYLISHPFKDAIEKLDSGYAAYHTNHFIMNNEKIMKKWFGKVYKDKLNQEVAMHHIVVYKKSIIQHAIPFLRDVVTYDKKLLNLFSLVAGEVYTNDTCSYVWRNDAGMNHKKNTIKDNPEIWHSKVKELEDILRAAHK